MKLYAALLKRATNAAWLFMPFLAFLQNHQLSLKPGFYVRDRVECKDSPNAANLVCDRVVFSGAYSSKCTSRVLSHHGPQSRVQTTLCAFAAIVQQCQFSKDLPEIPNAALTGLLFAAVHGLIDLQSGGRMRSEKGLTSVAGTLNLLIDLLSHAELSKK